MRDKPDTPGVGSRHEAFDLREWVSFAWRHWKFIAAVTAIVLVVGAAYLLNQTRLYTATAQVLLDPQTEKMPGGDVMLAQSRLNLAVIDSQIAIIRSTVFLRRVVERAHLVPTASAAADPVPASDEAGLLGAARGFVLGLIGSGRAESSDPNSVLLEPLVVGTDAIPAAELRAIEALRTSLNVARAPQRGHVLTISVTSPDPVEAARLTNAVAETYLVDKLDARLEAAKRASAWLGDRLVGLRAQLRESEEAVARFRAEHRLMQSGGATLNQQQLSELNLTLIQARAELAQKKARVDLLTSLQAKGGSLENMPDIAKASTLQTLRRDQANISAQEADLLARYNRGHPLVINIRAQLRDVERSIGSETARLAAGIRNEYELARARVASLEQNLQQATGRSSLDDATAVRLRELERTAAVNKTLFEDFLKQAKVTEEQSTFEPQEVRIITPALVPGNPSYPNKTRFMSMTLLVGLFFGVGGAFARDRLNSGFTTPKQVEDFLGLPLLASVSRVSSRDLSADGTKIPIHAIPTIKPLSRYSEAIRSLRSGVHMTDVDHPPKIVQVTSALPEEGKTTISLSLAASAASGGLRVLYIDADLRHPSATRVFGLQNEPGLVDLLVGDATGEAAIRFYESGGYWTIGAGGKTQNPTDLLNSERMKNLVAGFREDYDLVIIDTPPTGLVVDPVIVSNFSDKIVMIVRWGVTARELVKETVERLSGHRKIAGIAFNLVNERQAQKYGKDAYSYYYGRRYYKEYYS
ncbi:MAG: GumC family protein [Alphaproteobacteria bacterium]